MRPCHHLRPIIEDLARAQSELLRAADTVPVDRWKTRPAEEGRWPAGELVGHVSAIERAILNRAGKLLEKPPEPVPFFQAVSCSDDVRGSTREPAQTTGHARTQGGPQKEEMLAAELRGVRERTLAFIEKTRGGDLSKHRMAHPFLGSLNAYQWLQFLAAHEKRHMKQMRDIAGALPKTVTSLDK